MKRHKWSGHDLSIAYYVAKWGWYGIKEDQAYWANIIGTTEKSLNIQIVKYKRMLRGQGRYTNASKLQVTVFRHFSNKSITYVRDRVEELRNALPFNNSNNTK